MTFRVGHGFDIHRFSDDPARQLVLGGVLFEGERGLVGHSDADVAAHACTDAILSPAGLGDIGQHFPDTDPAWAGADSMSMLAHAVGLVQAAGFAVANIDLTIVCERPKIAPHKQDMQRNLSAVVGAPVMLKGKRAEGLGSLGRVEGIACWAVSLLNETANVHDEEAQ